MSYYYCIYDCVINGIQCYGGTCKSLESWNEYLDNPTYPIDFNSYFFRKVDSIDEVPKNAWGNGSKQMQEEREKLDGYTIEFKDDGIMPKNTMVDWTKDQYIVIKGIKIKYDI